MMHHQYHSHRRRCRHPDHDRHNHYFLQSGGVSSTFRDSKSAPFKWREQLTMQEVIVIVIKDDDISDDEYVKK